MKLTINKLYGYKVCHKRKARYTNSYYLALFEKHQLEKETNKKWNVLPTPKKECKRVWKNCPFNKLLGVKNENQFTSKR